MSEVNPKCVTHFTGCACQEAKLAQLTQELEAVKRDRDEALERVLDRENTVLRERDRLQAQLATAKEALEGILAQYPDGYDVRVTEIARKALADIQAQLQKPGEKPPEDQL